MEKLDNILGIYSLNCPGLRYVALEAIEKGCWFLYDSKTKKTCWVPFGDVFRGFFNAFVDTDKNSPYYQESVSAFVGGGLGSEADFSEMDFMAQRFTVDMKPLIDMFRFWDNVKKCREENPNETTKDLFQTWKTFRFAAAFKAWSSEYDEHTDLTMEKIVQRELCVPSGRVCWTDNGSGTAFVSRAFCLKEPFHLFPEDLFKILFSDVVESPQICKRCKRLYFSNNNKVLYCPDCREDRSAIAKENRKSNVCRYKHKQIVDKLSYQKQDTSAFRKESNLFWEAVQKGERTEEEYSAWLNEKLDSLRIRKGKAKK